MKKNTLAKGLVFFSGIIILLVGIITIFFPARTLYSFIIFLGIMLILSGLGYIVSYFADKEMYASPGWVLIQGFVDLFIGVILLALPTASMFALSFILGLWAMFGSITRLAVALNLKNLGFDKWWLMLITGIVGMLLAFLIILFPAVGAAIISAFISIFLIFFGAMTVLEVISIRKIEKTLGI